MIIALVAIALYIWIALSLSAVFAKVGRKPHSAWIPVYNVVVLLQIAGLSGWLAVLIVLPPALWVVLVIACHRIGRGFGLGAGMTVLAALLFPVWTSLVGWGSARWLGVGVQRSTPTPPSPATAPAVPAYTPVQPPHPGPDVPWPAGVTVPPRPAPPLPTATDDGGLRLGRSQAPFTQSVPSSFVPPAPLEPPPAEPRRAFSPARRDAGAAAASDPWAPPAATSAPAVASAPADSASGLDAALETSVAVSAVPGAPVLGAPRSARSSVSAQHRENEIAADDIFDQTVISSRRRPMFRLILPLGVPVAVNAEVVIVGRNPAPDPAHPGAQLVAVADQTRTVSKTHARLERAGERWTIIDLDSTNGVVLVGDDGAETEASPGTPAVLTRRFLLGDAELAIDPA